MSIDILWWGYLHINGSIHVKRYFNEGDLQEARESDFVLAAYGPFEAEGRADAIEMIKRIAPK